MAIDKEFAAILSQFIYVFFKFFVVIGTNLLSIHYTYGKNYVLPVIV